MKFKHSKAKAVSSLTLDITPVVDVVSNLLIFFALTLNFVTSAGIKVNLPTASSTSEPVKENITISLDKDGSVFYNEDQVSFAELRQYLKDADDKGPIVIIKADSKVFHGQVVQVMDMAKSAGFFKLSIAVEKKN